VFGANADKKAMDMTTPVQTTMSGEMRFIWIKLIFLIQSRMTKA
jgi:hypothetical protein